MAKNNSIMFNTPANAVQQYLGNVNSLGGLPGAPSLPQLGIGAGKLTNPFGGFNNPLDSQFFTPNAFATQVGGAGMGNNNPSMGNIVISPQGYVPSGTSGFGGFGGAGGGVVAPQTPTDFSFTEADMQNAFGGVSTDNFMQGVKPPSSGGFLGMGADGWSNVIGGLGTVGNLFLGYNAYKENKKNNAFNRKMATNNYNSQVHQNNVNVTRRARSNAQSLGLEGGDRDNFVSSREKEEHLNKM